MSKISYEFYLKRSGKTVKQIITSRSDEITLSGARQAFDKQGLTCPPEDVLVEALESIQTDKNEKEAQVLEAARLAKLPKKTVPRRLQPKKEEVVSSDVLDAVSEEVEVVEEVVEVKEATKKQPAKKKPTRKSTTKKATTRKTSGSKSKTKKNTPTKKPQGENVEPEKDDVQDDDDKKLNNEKYFRRVIAPKKKQS